MVQVFQTGTVVKFVEYDDLCHKRFSRQSAASIGRSKLPVSVVQHTLYAGYFLARKHVTCDAMKPAPPVTRIVLVILSLHHFEVVARCRSTRQESSHARAYSGCFTLVRSGTVPAYQCTSQFVWANSVKLPIFGTYQEISWYRSLLSPQYVSSRFSTLQRRDAAPE